MLATTLRTEFIPGANLYEGEAGGVLPFLMADLAPERVLCLGAPPPGTLSALCERADDVVVHKTPRFQESSGFGLESASFDLAAVCDREWLRTLLHSPAMRRELRGALKPDGNLYIDCGPGALRGWTRAAEQGLAAEFGGAARLWLAPRRGEFLMAATSGRAVAAYAARVLRQPVRLTPSVVKRPLRLFRRAQASVSGNGDIASGRDWGSRVVGGLVDIARRSAHCLLSGAQALERTLARPGLIGRYTCRRAVLFRTECAHGPPRYVCEAAARAGLDWSDYAWIVVGGGRYRSQKITFHLLPPGGDRAEFIVKLTGAPDLNERLFREAEALQRLQEAGFGDAESTPRIVFAEEHAGLAMIAETAIEGVPFDRRSRFSADCPLAADAVARLTELAVTGGLTRVGAAETATGLAELLDRFLELYRPEQAMEQFLRERLEALSQIEAPLPLVFGHGDPGRWNVLATPSGRAALLDWESAESDSLPAWDLFYFLRSFSVGVARRSDPSGALEALSSLWLRETAVSRLLRESVRRYVARVELPPAALEPLFYGCWFHRALKEATRLAPSRLAAGHYIRLLRLFIKNRGTPAMRALFAD
ncbi:MAG: aminoglycoside phosphotransferase family protein [Planctomycetes bacterium]|nr:aminoglycoside phosphotransferase family protein [Planctomycetota bacterium]